MIGRTEKDLEGERKRVKRKLSKIIDSFPLEYFDSVEVEYLPQCRPIIINGHSHIEVNGELKSITIRFDVEESRG